MSIEAIASDAVIAYKAGSLETSQLLAWQAVGLRIADALRKVAEELDADQDDVQAYPEEEEEEKFASGQLCSVAKASPCPSSVFPAYASTASGTEALSEATSDSDSESDIQSEAFGSSLFSQAVAKDSCQEQQWRTVGQRLACVFQSAATAYASCGKHGPAPTV